MPRPPQPLHIFRKDLLHLWPETLVVLLLFVALAAFVPGNWQGSPYAGIVQLVSILIHLLLPISWLILISRLIHDETLVGDRQFWTSRPYHWASLLAAKFLYLLVFIYLPFLLMQAYLLERVGLHPTTAIAGLLQNLLLISAVFVLPFAAMAAITSTFTRLLLSVIGGILYVLVAFGVAVWAIFERMRPPVLGSTIIWVVVVFCFATLIYQYATRRTLISRLILAATPIVLVLVVIALPAGAFMNSSYSATVGVGDPTLGDFPEQFRPQAASPGTLVTFRNEAHLQIPFSIANADQDSAYRIRGVAASVTSGSVHWQGTFTEPEQEQQISAGQPISAVTISVPLNIYNQIKDARADVHLTLATEHLKLDKPQTWIANTPAFDVPGHGRCKFAPADGEAAEPTCFYALRAPEVNLATAKLNTGSCNTPAVVPGRSRLTQQPGLPNLFDPVATLPLTFATGDPNPQHHYQLCAGAPITFVSASQAGKLRFEVDVKGLILDHYALRVHPQPTGPQAAPTAEQP